MNLTRRIFCAAAAAALLVAAPAAAQTFPNGPVTLIVPYPPGGQIDMIARLLQPGLEKELGVAVVVENRPGAGGNVGSAAAFRAEPDGQTIVLATDAVMTLNPLIYSQPPFDPATAAHPVMIVSESTLALAVATDFPAKDVPELVAKSKETPEGYSFGSSGTPQQIVGELLKQLGDANLTYIPYPGVANVLTDILGGHIEMGIGTISSVKPQVDAGKLRLLAVTNATRLPTFPNVPTLSEYYPEIVANTWSGIFAPAGTPAEAVDRLNAALKTVLGDPAVKARLESTSEMILASSPQQATERVAADTARWKVFLQRVEIPKI